jgi:RNA polymerase-binding transcription factor DksA
MKPKTAAYRKILEKKAEEVRRSMSAQKAAQVVARLDVPSDEGDLSQQHHEEWIFLNRNTIDMKLLREIADALHRMDAGHYGVCPECEEPFPPNASTPCRGRVVARQSGSRGVHRRWRARHNTEVDR